MEHRSPLYTYILRVAVVMVLLSTWRLKTPMLSCRSAISSNISGFRTAATHFANMASTFYLFSVVSTRCKFESASQIRSILAKIFDNSSCFSSGQSLEWSAYTLFFKSFSLAYGWFLKWREHLHYPRSFFCKNMFKYWDIVVRRPVRM